MRRARWIVPALLAALACALGGAPAPAAAQDGELELKVKAAFLFNFAKFVSWPEGKFASGQSPIELCVLEPDPFGPILDETVRGKQVAGRPLLVRRGARAEDLRGCHLLYISARDATALAGVLARLEGAGVMTVHEATQPLAGGVARLFLEERKMRFEINTAAADKESLQLSSRLLSVASVVQR